MVCQSDKFPFIELNIDEQSDISEMINQEISKFQFYQDI